MHYRKIIALMGVPLFLASCAPKKAAPNASPIYFFAARPAPAQPAPVEMQGISDPERGLKSMSQAFKAGNFDAALKIARGLAEQHPGTSWYRRSLFLTEQVLIRMDRPSEADSAMLRVKAEYPEMADYAVFLLAEYHFSGGRFTQAAALYQDITERYPKSSLAVRAAYQQAQALHGASAFAPEADVLEAFLRNNPGSELAANAQLALGRALAAEARMDRAVQAYREVWVRYPGTAPDQEAVKALSELSASGYQVAPWTGDEWYERGKNLFRAAQYDKSVEAFRKLLEAEPNTPNRPDALFRTGVALFHLGRRGDAAAALEKMVKQYPLDHRVPEALYWTGRSYGRLNEREKGIATLHKIVNAHPRSEWADDALFMIGNIYRDASDTRKALAVYSRLATEYPESKFADSALWWNAWTYYNAGEYAKVETALQELINRYPRSFLVHQARYWQGRTAEKTGNPAKAAEYYGKVLKRGPYTYYGYRAAERLSASPNLKEPIPVPDAVVDVIPAACEEEECLDGSPSPLETEDGPPVWTDETRQLLAAEPSFKKTLELMHLDMKKEAAAELWHLQGKVPRRRGALIGLSKAFFELGDYYRSLILVLRNYERYLDGEVRETPADLWLLPPGLLGQHCGLFAQIRSGPLPGRGYYPPGEPVPSRSNVAGRSARRHAGHAGHGRVDSAEHPAAGIRPHKTLRVGYGDQSRYLVHRSFDEAVQGGPASGGRSLQRRTRGGCGLDQQERRNPGARRVRRSDPVLGDPGVRKKGAPKLFRVSTHLRQDRPGDSGKHKLRNRTGGKYRDRRRPQGSGALKPVLDAVQGMPLHDDILLYYNSRAGRG